MTAKAIGGTPAEVAEVYSRTDAQFGKVDERISQLHRELSILQLNISSYLHSGSTTLKAGDLASAISDVQKLSQFFKNSGKS